jgi:hypothetical protein
LIFADIQASLRDDDDAEPDEPGDFGLMLDYFGYARQMVALVLASRFTVFPEPGGLNDQDERFLADLEAILRLRRRARWEIKNGFTHDDPVDDLTVYESFD